MWNIAKWTLVYVLICLSLGLAYADPKTEEVIKDIRSKASAVSSWRTNFVMKMEKMEMMGIVLSQKYEGKLSYKKPNMVNIEINMTGDFLEGTMIAVSDGDFFYEYMSEKKVVHKTSLKEIGGIPPILANQIFVDPNELFENAIKSEVQYVGEEGLDGKKMHVLEGKFSEINPFTGGEMPFYYESKLWIGIEDGVLRKMDTFNGQTTISLEFKNIELNPTFTEDIFRFIPPEGVHIQDGTEVTKNPFSNKKAMELFTYANINAENRKYDQALQTIQTIDEPFLKVMALINLANEYREKDKILETLSQSLRVTQTIEDVFYKTEALNKISTNYAEIGQYEQAIQIANMIEKTYNKVLTLTNIASKYMRDGQKEKALEMLSQAFQIAQTIEKTDEKAGALTNISGKYAEIGQYDQALQVAQTIMEGSLSKVDALTNIADKYAKDGQKDKIPEALFQALQAVQRIEDIYLKNFLLEGIIDRYEASGVKVDEHAKNLIDEMKKELKNIK